MDLEELKKYLKVDGNDLDVVLAGYQAAAESYLTNAGVAKDYANALYKTVVTVFVGKLLEDPTLLGKGDIGASIGFTAFIAQLRLSQGATI
jgi:uncharacterized phage protein (predicted DNA packaging)